MDRDGSLAATTGPVAEPRALSQQTLPNMWNIAKCSTQYRSEKRNDSQPNMDARSAQTIPNIRLETDYIRISLSGVNERAPSFHIYGHQQQQQQRSQQQIPIRYDQNGFRISGEIVATDDDQSDNQRPAKLILELDGNVYHVDLARLQLEDENNQKRVERRNPKQQIDDTSCTFLPNDDDIVWLVSDDDDDDDDDCDDIQILPTPKSNLNSCNQDQNQDTNSNQKGRPDSIIETNQMQQKESKQNSCSAKTMTTLNEKKKSKNCSKINPNCSTNNNNNNNNDIVVEESEDVSFSASTSASAVQICANRCKSFEQKIDACLERLNRNVENFDCSPETLQFVIDTLQSFTGLYEVYIRNDAASGGALFRPIYRSKVDQILHMCAEQFRLASEFANVERLQDSISIIVDETCRIVRRTLFDNVENDNEKLKITLDKIYKLIKSLLPFRLLSISTGAVRATPSSFQQAPKLLVDILQLLINPCPFARALLLTALLKLSRTMLSYGPDSVITDYHRRFFANDRGQKTSVDSEEEMDPRNIRLSAEKLILSHLRICEQELDRMAAAANDVKRRSSSLPIMEFLDRAQHYDEVYFEFVQIARLYYDHDRDNKCASTSKNRDHNSSDNYISEMKDIAEKLHRHLAGGEHRHAPTPQFTRLIRPELEMLANLRKPCSFVRALLADADTSNGEEEKRKAALSAANIDKRTQDESRNNDDDDNVKIEQCKSDQSKSSDKKRAKKDSKKCSKKKRNNEKRFKSKFADRLMWFLKMANEKHYMAKIFDKIDHKLSSLICRSGENESGLPREVSSIHRSGNKAIAENEISRNNNNNMKNKRKCESATTIESADSEANNDQRMIDDDDEILLVYDKRDDNADDDHHRKRKMQKKNNNSEQEIQQQRLTPEEEEIDQQELVERIEVLAVQDSLEEDRGGEISQKGNLKLITNKCDDVTRTTRVHLRSEEERAKYQSQNSQPLTVKPVTTEIEKISENEEATKQTRKRVLSLHLDDEDDDDIQESYDIHQSTVDADILKAKKSKTTTNFEDNANKATKEFSPIELDASTHQESQNFENEDNIEIIMEIRKLQSDIHRFQTEIAAIMQQLQQNPD